MMTNTKLLLIQLVFMSVHVIVKSASIATHHTVDGFSLIDFMPGRTYSYGVAPKSRGQEMSMAFYDVDVISRDCDVLRVDVYDDGYVKSPFNRIAILCDRNGLEKFTAVSERGFHVVVTMGTNTNGGGLKGRFKADGGIRVTNEVLY